MLETDDPSRVDMGEEWSDSSPDSSPDSSSVCDKYRQTDELSVHSILKFEPVTPGKHIKQI